MLRAENIAVTLVLVFGPGIIKFPVFFRKRIFCTKFKEFLDDYVVEVGGGKKFIGTAAKVIEKFFEWAKGKGYIDEKAFEVNSEVLRKYKKRY